MRRKTLQVRIYEDLIEGIENYQKEHNLKESEAVREILEDAFGIPQERREAYKRSVIEGRNKGNKSPKRKIGRHKVKRKIRRAMDRTREYSLRELADLAGLTRQLTREVVGTYPEDFEVRTNHRGFYFIRKRSVKERDEYKRKHEEWLEEQQQIIESKQRKRDLGIDPE